MNKMVLFCFLTAVLCSGYINHPENESTGTFITDYPEPVDSSYINLQEEILKDFIEEINGMPRLTLDSVLAVDHLKISPQIYYRVKESIRWKKNYPPQDIYRLAAWITEDKHNRWILQIDSVKAIRELKIDPSAYRDLKSNLFHRNWNFSRLTKLPSDSFLPNPVLYDLFPETLGK